MARAQETFGKKEREKKRLKKRKDKEQKKEERKANSLKGQGLDSMIAYVDEFGNFSETPPDPSKKKKIDAKSIELGVPKREEEEFDPIRKGKVAYFNHSKGYGFISDRDSSEQYFVHVNGLLEEVTENDKVKFELEK